MSTFFRDYTGKAKSEINGELEKALAESALHMEACIKANTPVDTGRLRSSITSRSSLLAPGAKKGEALVGTNVEYAAYVEYGTKFQRPQPYMRAGAADAEDGIETIFKKHLGSVVLRSVNLNA